MKVLVLGATGMLGHMVFTVLGTDPRYETWGTLRDAKGQHHFPPESRKRLLANVDVLQHDQLVDAFARTRPDAVINCIGLIKQLSSAKDPLAALPVNAMLPHRLAALCALASARLVHLSTDCVFSGRKGMYAEDDPSDAEDLYGKSKHLGEPDAKPGLLTLRTSMIGHELASRNSLVDWFLAQKGTVRGYTRAIFSGLPTVEIATFLRDVALPSTSLHGLYHLAAQPISKHALLTLVSRQYDHAVEIVPDESVHTDRSLDASRLQRDTGYEAPGWEELVRRMHGSRPRP